MWVQIILTCVTIFGTGVTASLSYWLTKRHEQLSTSHQRKVEQYTDLFEAISAVAGHEKDAVQRFVRAYNKMLLVAPQDVLNALTELLSKMNDGPQPLGSPAQKGLILAIRRDLGIQPADSIQTFHASFMRPADKAS